MSRDGRGGGGRESETSEKFSQKSKANIFTFSSLSTSFQSSNTLAFHRLLPFQRFPLVYQVRVCLNRAAEWRRNSHKRRARVVRRRGVEFLETLNARRRRNGPLRETRIPSLFLCRFFDS